MRAITFCMKDYVEFTRSSVIGVACTGMWSERCTRHMHQNTIWKKNVKILSGCIYSRMYSLYAFRSSQSTHTHELHMNLWTVARRHCTPQLWKLPEMGIIRPHSYSQSVYAHLKGNNYRQSQQYMTLRQSRWTAVFWLTRVRTNKCLHKSSTVKKIWG